MTFRILRGESSRGHFVEARACATDAWRPVFEVCAVDGWICWTYLGARLLVWRARRAGPRVKDRVVWEGS